MSWLAPSSAGTPGTLVGGNYQTVDIGWDDADDPIGSLAMNPLAGTWIDGSPLVQTNVPKVQEIYPADNDPAAQYSMLSSVLAAGDAANPAPFTGTPPWDEYTEPDEITPDVVLQEAYGPFPSMDPWAGSVPNIVGSGVPVPQRPGEPANLPYIDYTDTHGQQNNALASPLERLRENYPMAYPSTDDVNSPQYFGLGVPPGTQAIDQPFETGHTQNVRPDSSKNAGLFAWSGKPALARVARHENDDYGGYGADVDRHFGERSVMKLEMPLVYQTQQYRDLLLSELKRRGVHNVVVADVPSVPYTAVAMVTDPWALVQEPDLGEEGVYWDDMPVDESFQPGFHLATAGTQPGHWYDSAGTRFSGSGGGYPGVLYE